MGRVFYLKTPGPLRKVLRGRGRHRETLGHVMAGNGQKMGAAAANERLKLTGAAILVFRASTSLQAAPAA